MQNHMSSLQLWPVWHRPKNLHTLPGGVLPKPRWGILMQDLSNGALPKRDWADLVSLVFSWKISTSIGADLVSLVFSWTISTSIGAGRLLRLPKRATSE